MKYVEAWEALRDWLNEQGDSPISVSDVFDKIEELEQEYE